MNFRYFLFFVTLIASVWAQSAAAQPNSQDSNGWKFGVGGGVRLAPNYVGDDDYRMSVLPSIRIEYGDKFFASIENGVGYNAINRNGFQAGPIARIRFGRNEDGSQPFAITGDRTNDLIGLGDVDATAELGGFFKYQIKSITSALEIRRGVNGHNGTIFDASVSYSGRSFAAGPPIIYSFGPRFRVVSENYQSAYFGIDASQSIASGLPQYSAAGGLNSFGVGATVILPLSRKDTMSMVLVSGLDRLAGDAADSPLVQQRGSRTQASTGLFFTYWFK